jgi:nitrogen fixation/metabolism regulation signal transduction histidine kinase
MTRTLRYLVAVGGGIVCILLFLLATASDNSGFFDRYYSWLLGLNAAIAVSLLVLVGVSLARLYSRYKRGKFGSKLMARLVLMFATIGILPGLVIFLVSVQFVSHSIESWFDVRVEAALESGLNLGRAGLDVALVELNAHASAVVQELAGQTPDKSQAILAQLLKAENGLQSATLVDANARLIGGVVADPTTRLETDLPTAAMLVQAAAGQAYAAPEGGIELRMDGQNGLTALDAATSLRLRVLIAIPDPRRGATGRYLQLLQSVPANLASNAEVLRTAYSEYKERFVARVGLRKMYIETLTLTLLLAIFGAIASAFLIASNLAKPLLLLAEGTRAVAEGDLSPRPIVATKDELGTLTQSFNKCSKRVAPSKTIALRCKAQRLTWNRCWPACRPA